MPLLLCTDLCRSVFFNFAVANAFSKSLRRKTSLTHLAQAARTVLHSPEAVTQMVSDWQEIDFNEIVKQTLWTFSANPEADCEIVKTCKYSKRYKLRRKIILFLARADFTKIK